MPDEDEEGRTEPTRPTSKGLRRSLVVPPRRRNSGGGDPGRHRPGRCRGKVRSCGQSPSFVRIFVAQADGARDGCRDGRAGSPHHRRAGHGDRAQCHRGAGDGQHEGDRRRDGAPERGAQASDIQTSDLSVQPQYVYQKGIPMVSGYQVDNTITATLLDIATSGAVIDAVVGAAGNAAQIESLSFSTRVTGVVEARARARATTQAVVHARGIGSRGWTVPRARVLADGSDPGVGARSTDQRPRVCLGRRRPRCAD